MQKLVWVGLLWVGLLSFAAETPAVPGRWFVPVTDMPKGIVLVFHGLNLAPAKMDPLATQLERAGYEVFRAELAGHRGSLREFQEIEFNVWIREAFVAYKLVADRARELKVPFHVIGFSLGGVLAETIINLSGNDVVPQPSSVVLLAPALSIRSRSYLVNALGVFGSSFVVPSRSPVEYRANRGTPMAGYYALFDGVDRLERTKYYRANVKTLLVIDPNDEVVSYSGLVDLKERHHLSQWKILTVDVRQGTRLKRPYHHLIIDEPALGARNYHALVEKILQHFE